MSRLAIVVADPLAVPAEESAMQALVLPVQAYLGWLPPWPERLADRDGQVIEAELADHVALSGLGFLPPGAVVSSGPGRLPYGRLLHLVVADVFGDASVERLAQGIQRAVALAREFHLTRLWLPTFVVPGGVLDLDDFAWALRHAWRAGTDADLAPGPELIVAAGDDKERRRVANIVGQEGATLDAS